MVVVAEQELVGEIGRTTRVQATTWCGFDQLGGRSQPGNRQPRSLIRKPRRRGAEVTRVARPTSISIESASSTREMVICHVIRSNVPFEIGGESSGTAGVTPTTLCRRCN